MAITVSDYDLKNAIKGFEAGLTRKLTQPERSCFKAGWKSGILALRKRLHEEI